ncbi:hypothetical protein Tco_0245648 [Tanacetum coccineum]
MLTARKSVGSLPTHRLALRYSADYSSSDHFTSDDSSGDSHQILHSLCDSPTATSARPSRKRCRSPTLSVHVASPVLRALSLVRANLLLPHKRIRDFNTVTDFEVSSEEGYVLNIPREIGLRVDVKDSYEPYTYPNVDFDIQADINAYIEFADDIAARWTDVRVKDETAAKEEVDSSIRGTTEIGVDRVTHPVVTNDIDEPIREDFPDLFSADGSLERDHGHRIVATSQQSAAMLERIGTLERDNMRLRGMLDVERQRVTIFDVVCPMPTAKRFGMTHDAINELIAKYVEEALKAYDAARNPKTKTEMKNEQQDDNVEANVNNGNGNGNGNGNLNVNNKGVVLVTRECTYQDFVKCQPLNFKGTEGVIGLTCWFEKMETMFHISNCPPRTVGVDAAYAMMWKALMKLMTKRFQKLTLLCTKMVPKEEDQVEKYIGGLPDNIQENIIAAEPTRLQDAFCIANNLMDRKLKGYAIKNVENKRRFDNNSRDNRGQHQQPFKRQNVDGPNVARAYIVENNVERRGYVRALPYYNSCRLHHEGPCTVKYGNCKRFGHMIRDCKAVVVATRQRAPV